MTRFHQLSIGALLLICAGPVAAQPIHVLYPQSSHLFYNGIPFSQSDGVTYHQVYASSLFANLYSGMPVEISELAFAPGRVSGSLDPMSFDAHLVVRLGYTQFPPGGLLPPDVAGGGVPNASGPMHLFYEGRTQYVFLNPGQGNFQFTISGSPFEYDPSLGHLLVEIIQTERIFGVAVSRTDGGVESSRSFASHASGSSGADSAALITRFTLEPFDPIQPCYANCDGSTTEPILTVDDFTCFINEFASAQSLPTSQQIEHYANCDGSTTEPILTVDDFTCFINAFAQGCP